MKQRRFSIKQGIGGLAKKVMECGCIAGLAAGLVAGCNSTSPSDDPVIDTDPFGFEPLEPVRDTDTTATPQDSAVAPVNYNYLIEAESRVNNVGSFRFRTNASSGRTLHLIERQMAQYRVKHEPGTYNLRIRYSNDDNSQVDMISVTYNQERIGTFHGQDTGNWGYGWNNFVYSPNIRIVVPDTTVKWLAIRIDNADVYGIELDKIEVVK